MNSMDDEPSLQDMHITHKIISQKVEKNFKKTSTFAFNPGLCKADTGIDEIVVDEICREYLQPVGATLCEALCDEQSSISMDSSSHRFNAYYGVIWLRCDRVLYPVEEFPRRDRLLLAQMLQIAVEFGRWQVRVDPIVLQMSSVPERGPWFRTRGLVRFPHTYDPLWQEFGNCFVEHMIILMNQEFPEVILQVFLEICRIFVAEFGSNLENYNLGLCLGQELLDIIDDNIYTVCREDPMADETVLVNSNIQQSGTFDKLLVDRQRLTLRKRPRDQRNPDLVRRRIVCSGPYNLVYMNFLRTETGHPVLPISRTVIASRVRLAATNMKLAKGLLLRLDCLSPLHLLREQRPHFF